MLRLASGDPVRHNRHRRPFPLESEVPGFQEYLRSECGLMESTIQGYRHHLHEFEDTKQAPLVSVTWFLPGCKATLQKTQC